MEKTTLTIYNNKFFIRVDQVYLVSLSEEGALCLKLLWLVNALPYFF